MPCSYCFIMACKRAILRKIQGMKRQPKHKLYPDAECMFVDNGYTSLAISEALGISEATLCKWRKDYEWDRKREETLASPYRIREILMKELASIAGGNKSTINADDLIKIQKVFASFEKSSSSIPIILSVFKEFDNWMSDVDPETAVLFTTYQKKYLHHVAQLKSE